MTKNMDIHIEFTVNYSKVNSIFLFPPNYTIVINYVIRYLWRSLIYGGVIEAIDPR